jgi:hypothetical protein
MPCQVTIAAIDDVPRLSVSHDHGLSFTGEISLDFECRRNNDDQRFYQLMTINSKPIHMSAVIEIQDHMTLILNVQQFDLKIKNVTDSDSIGPVNLFVLSGLLDILEPLLTTIMNLAFKNGIDLTSILKWLKLDFIEFDATLLKPMDGYFIFYLTPSFNLEFVDDFMIGMEDLFNDITVDEEIK